MTCEKCNKSHPEVSKAPVMTMYADGNDPQPMLCPDCMQEWIEHWQEKWNEYRSGLGV